MEVCAVPTIKMRTISAVTNTICFRDCVLYYLNLTVSTGRCVSSPSLQGSSSTFTPPTAPLTPDTSDPRLYFPVVAIVIIVVVVSVFVLAAAFITFKCLQVC